MRRHLADHRAVVVSAAPGAGKTTRLPAALIDRGPVILLQPRRVAARAVTRRIAEEHGWTIGREAGWQMRYERRSSSETRLLVVTEGILTARLQQDPLLSDFATVVFDEFHERSIHSDLGLALAKQAWRARDELHIVVMSATLDVARVAKFLGDCPVVEVAGTRHPLTVEYAPDESMSAAVAAVLPRSRGQVLCFLPGVGEIERARHELMVAPATRAIEVVALHGSLEGDAQDRALRPASPRRVILATNIAETSLTVPGVDAVVDSGWHKVVRYDGTRAIDSLTTERVSRDAADQRAGRAARLRPGLARRLWDPRLRLRAHREPDIARLDLAGPLLYLLAWGADVARFDWFESPPPERVADALRLLERLGAVAGNRLTAHGRQMQQLPVHPRLACILIDGGGALDVVKRCAAMSGDLAFEQPLQRVVAQVLGDLRRPTITDDELRHAVFAGYGDRLARRRRDAPDRVVLASGHGAVLARECESIGGEYLVALDVTAGTRAGAAEALVRSASEVNAEWVAPTSVAVEHRFDPVSGRVRAFRIARYDALVLAEHAAPIDPLAAAEILAAEWVRRGPDERTAQWLHRARFAGHPIAVEPAIRQAAVGAESLADLDLVRALSPQLSRRIATEAPDQLPLPSGRSARLEYAADGSVAAAVKLQELFGLAESPRLGPQRVPVTFHLLAPNGRPVQTTRDLRSFWERTYPQVRKELRGRYPKHPWPEDPWTAPATHRTMRRGGG